jgi:Spy/CpxP family protein refolding chaperone
MNYLKSAALAVVIMAAAQPVYSQQPDRAPRPPRPPMADRADRVGEMRRPGGGGVEGVLRMRQELKLSDAQVNQLEALRKEIVAQRQNEARDMIDLRSRAEAGNLDREEARKQFESRRDAMRETMKQRQEKLEKILTDDQRTEMRHLQRERMDRAHMRERGERGFDRGDRGRRFREPPRGRYRW